jgi:hypothetical protein
MSIHHTSVANTMLLVSLLIFLSTSAMAANTDGNGNIYHQSSSVPLRSQDSSKNQRLPPKLAPKKKDFDAPPEDARDDIHGCIFDSLYFLV